MFDLIIIGYGISGVSCARWASEYGLNYIILEQNSNLGGVWFNKKNENTQLQTPKKFSYIRGFF